MGVHTFNVITVRLLLFRYENEENIKNSNQGEREDHFMMSYLKMSYI